MMSITNVSPGLMPPFGSAVRLSTRGCENVTTMSGTSLGPTVVGDGAGVGVGTGVAVGDGVDVGAGLTMAAGRAVAGATVG